MSGGRFVEIDQSKAWTSKADKQRRPDQDSRLKSVIPRDRLVVKRGRTFTTDTSSAARQKEIERHEIPGSNSASNAPKPRQYTSKN